MKNIVVNPPDVWEFYLKNRYELVREMMRIASDNNVGIYLTLDGDLPCVWVYLYDKLSIQKTITSKDECEGIISRIYKTLLTSAETEEESSRVEREEMIIEREIELNSLVFDFVSGAIGDKNVAKEVCDTATLHRIKEDFIEILANDYNISVYRPGFTYDEDGNEMFELYYPYKEIGF